MDRCVGCTRPLDKPRRKPKPSSEVFRIDIGEVSEENGVFDFDVKKSWGFMHRRCFLAAIGSPELTLG